LRSSGNFRKAQLGFSHLLHVKRQILLLFPAIVREKQNVMQGMAIRQNQQAIIDDKNRK
jgi:hypothetical protein